MAPTTAISPIVPPSTIPLPLRLPPDLLPILVELSDAPLQTYTRLLGLCHATRTAVRGAPRELVFFSDDGGGPNDGEGEDPLIRQVTTPTADALAALVGPCKGLVKLTLDLETLPGHWWGGDGRTDAATWVDEAFAGHSRLAVLEVTPSHTAALMSALTRIVGHLHGLEEVRVSHGFGSWDWGTFDGPLLAALGQSCPRLRLLHMDLRAIFHGAALQGLAPIAGTLEDVQVPLQFSDYAWSGKERENSDAGLAFLRSLASVRKLSLFRCPAEILGLLAPHLTHLRFYSSSTTAPADEGLCRLERLELPSLCVDDGKDGMVALARLLTANTATLRTVSLGLFLRQDTALSPLHQLAGLLDGLPHLTGLTLVLEQVPSRAAVFGALPPGLLDRLEQLALDLGCQPPCRETHDTIRIASRRLRTLRLNIRVLQLDSLPDAPILELACPRLEALTLPKSIGGAIEELVLECPQLRSIEGLPARCRNRWTAMPNLVRVRGRCLWGSRDDAPQWCSLDGLPQLLEGSPRLRRLPRLRQLSRDPSGEPAALAQLLEAGSLTRLSVYVPLSALPSLHSEGLHTMRLPAQLERLEVTFAFDRSDSDDKSPVLRVEAAGLRALTVRLELRGDILPHRPALSICCPALVALDADLSLLRSFALTGQHPPLLNLAVNATPQSPPSEAAIAGLSECLLAAATTLRRVSLRGPGFSASRLATALGRLPQLAVLHLADPSANEEVALACPHLKRLCLTGAIRSLALDCPLLETFVYSPTVYATAEQFELAGPVPPDLRPQCPTGGFDELAKRFPWLRQIPHTS
ncbi:hypothetical protein PAPYR_7050 [Paratrimastix pyriformis]|uniref:Uncharacterized protein n=1 Tax=Paratrimastix pyriformis TaxID=342808 RepID=A0ABQ8UGB9_9EUKA|nr:hypothetical protein PAPYR_7050 [Paratrimastix pyriformis]